MGLATPKKHFSIGLCYKDKGKPCCNWDGKGPVIPFDSVKTDATAGPCKNQSEDCPWARGDTFPVFDLRGPVTPYPRELMRGYKPEILPTKREEKEPEVKLPDEEPVEVKKKKDPVKVAAKKVAEEKPKPKRAKKDTGQLNMFGSG